MSRVILLSPSAKPAGSERVVASLARHLPGNGFEPIPVLLEAGPLETWLAAAGHPALVVDAGRFRHLPLTIATIDRLRRMVARVGAEAVVASQSKGHIYAGVAARLAGVPELWWQHGVPARTPQERLAAAVPTDAIVCSSDEVLRAQLRVRKTSKLVKIAVGVSTSEVARWRGAGAAVRRELGWSDRRIVGIVGRLEEWKGQTVFLRAVSQLRRSHPDVRYAIVGGAVLGWEGTYPNRLRELAAELGISDVVHFAGHREDVYAWFDAFDVAVHASLGEPFGLVLVEAMALGKPVVATNLGGPTEIVEQGKSGLLVAPGDEAELAGAVARILDDPDLAARLGRGGIARAERFTDEAMTARFAELLRTTIAAAGSGR